MKRNLTIQLDEKVIQKARIVAAKRSMSISRLVGEEISRAADKDMAWENAKKTALRQLDNPFHLGGGKLPSRESLHQR